MTATISTDIKRINYKSDFDFVARLMVSAPDGTITDIGFPSYDWEMRISSGCNGYTQFVASAKGGKLKNCVNDNGQLRIVCDNHGLRVGKLFAEFYAYLPNDIYPDGEQLVVNPQEIGIELVADAGDEPTDIEIQLALPFIYDSAYRQAVSAGYKGTQEEYMALASMLPNAVETAIKIQGSADSLADSAETIGSAIETLGATTDAIEQGANVIKDNADTLQESATIVRTSAEQIGGNIADLQASVSSIDSAVEGINQGAFTIANSATKVEASATTLEGVSAIISGSATSLAVSATAIAEGANTIKGSADVLQENADKVSESADKVEQSVEPLVQASESLNSTKQAFEMLSSEWADGRKAIATALTNRRYPTEPTESFHAMADKITNMSYEEGWFAKIGYTDENDGGIQEAIDYSYELAKGWNPDGSTAKMFRYNGLLRFLPYLPFDNAVDTSYMFQGCSGLNIIANKEIPNTGECNYMFDKCVALFKAPKMVNPITSATLMFADCSSLREVDTLIFNKNRAGLQAGQLFSNCRNLIKVTLKDTESITYWFGTFNNCEALQRIEGIDLSTATRVDMSSALNKNLTYIDIKNLGKSSLTSFPFGSNCFPVWGVGSDEARQSLIDSLITYSYDRASNGMPTATITLSANTKALLTEEEIAQITAKGFSIA